jgi:hypothetical protein
MVIWGATYGLMPRITGAEPHPVLVGTHFWLAFVGFLIYVVSISVAGILQGFSWVAGESFIASVVAAEPMWLWRTVGGGAGVVSFHTNHRLLVAVAFFGYLALTYLIAIGPAFEVQNTLPLPGAPARSAEAARGRELYLAEGCGFCHTQFLRDLPMDHPYGRPSLAEDRSLPSQARVQRDLDAIERLRHRATKLRRVGDLGELHLVELRHASLAHEVTRADRKTAVSRFDRHARLRIDSLGLVARLAELERQRHGETRGVRGRKQLFRVGPVLRFEARAE